MPNKIMWDASPSMTSYLTTELNSLANAARVLGAEINNATGLDRYIAVECYVAAQGSARSAGAYLGIYIIKAIDGTNYEYGDASVAPGAHQMVAALPLDAATTARYVSAVNILVPPFKFKLIIENQTGQAFAATLSTMKYGFYSEEVQ